MSSPESVNYKPGFVICDDYQEVTELAVSSWEPVRSSLRQQEISAVDIKEPPETKSHSYSKSMDVQS